MLQNGKLRSAVDGKITASIDLETLEVEAESIRKHIKKLSVAKDKLGEQIDRLDAADRHYDAKFDDMQKRLESLYDEIDLANRSLEDKLIQISHVREQHMTSEQVYDYLSVFDIMYRDFTDAEKKAFLQSFIKEIQIFPEPQADGRILKSIELNIPVYLDGEETRFLFPKSENTDETVCFLYHQKKDFISVHYEPKDTEYLKKIK